MTMVSLRALLCNLLRTNLARGIATSLALLAMTARARADEALPSVLDGVGIAEHLGAAIPLETTFRNAAGDTVALRSFFDGKRPVVLTLAYYECPMLCGLLLNGLSAALRELNWTVGNQFTYVNVSIDPREEPALAQAKQAGYLQNYGRPGAAKGWHFLIGEEGNIRTLTEAVGFKYRYDATDKQYAHAAAAFVLTPDGKISRYLYGIDFRPRDLKLAMLEAADGKVGTITERLLMFCYHYDPTTKKYALVATRFMKVGGVVTVAGIALLLFRLGRKKERSPC